MPDFVVGSILVWIATAGVVVFLLLTLDSIALGRALRKPPIEAAGTASRRPRNRRRLAVGAAVLVVAGLGLSGLLLAAAYDPLRAAGPANGSGNAYLGTEPATFGGVDELVFETLPGGEVQMEFGLVNTGEFPLTVEGLDDPVVAQGYVLNDWLQSFALGPSGPQGGAASNGFEIQPGAAVRVAARFELKRCAGWDAMPKLAPGVSPSALDALAATKSFYSAVGFTSVPIVYDALGFRHVSQVVLPGQITIVTADPEACSSVRSFPPSSGGPQPTPVPSIAFP